MWGCPPSQTSSWLLAKAPQCSEEAARPARISETSQKERHTDILKRKAERPRCGAFSYPFFGYEPISSLSSLLQVPSLEQAHQQTLNSGHVQTCIPLSKSPMKVKWLFNSYVFFLCSSMSFLSLPPWKENKSDKFVISRSGFKWTQSDARLQLLKEQTNDFYDKRLVNFIILRSIKSLVYLNKLHSLLQLSTGSHRNNLPAEKTSCGQAGWQLWDISTNELKTSYWKHSSKDLTTVIFSHISIQNKLLHMLVLLQSALE